MIAEKLKECIERDTFNSGIDCFVSSQNIKSGADWYDKIRKDLSHSKMGILVITKENIKAPWIYFEAGALVARNLNVIPLLVNCDQQSLKDTPINANQSVQFYQPERFKKMLKDIRSFFGLLAELDEDQIDLLFENSYQNLRKKIEPILNELKKRRYFSERYIYPQGINTMKMDTVFISAPMSTLTEEEYEMQHVFLEKLKKSLIQKIGFNEVICPALDTGTRWEGITTAINNNYKELRQIEHLIVLYPKSIPTSSLIEIGYGIALCKNTVIFHKVSLPYMLDGAAQDILHLHTRSYSTETEIIEAIENDRSLFEVRQDE